MMWVIIMLISFILFISGIFYVCRKMKLFGIKNKYIPYIIVCAFVLLLTFVFNFTTAAIILIHYLVIWILMDIVCLLVQKISKRNFKVYVAGLITIIFVPLYIGYGVYNVYDVKKTNYNIKTNKIKNKYRIALISDSHMGTTFDGDGFNKYLKEIESYNPDMLLIAGDFVDDGTSKEDMIKSCGHLGEFKTKYGIFFAHGNHDKGYYGNKRGYSKTDLESELIKNGVTVLQDESVLINDEIYVLGRKDFEDVGRKSISDLVKGLDKNKFIIDINHQPTDYDNEYKSNVDLVVSGHTHGGQFIPLNLISTYISQNDKVYGYEKINNTNFIVTSGISDWEIKFKTGCISEYVIIDIN